MRDFRFPPRGDWGLRSTEMLDGVGWWSVTDSSRQLNGSILKGQGVFWDCLTLEVGPINCRKTSVTNYWVQLDPWRWDRYVVSKSLWQTISPRRPASQKNEELSGHNLKVLALPFRLYFLAEKNNVACTTRRYDHVHDLSQFHLHMHSFSSLFIARTTKGKEIWGRPPCYFTFYKNIYLKIFTPFQRLLLYQMQFNLLKPSGNFTYHQV
jgi:hypothetical protein